MRLLEKAIEEEKQKHLRILDQTIEEKDAELEKERRNRMLEKQAMINAMHDNRNNCQDNRTY